MIVGALLTDVTPRLYQETILNTCVLDNTLVVLPTGLGKTLIAMMLAAQRLMQYPGTKILVLAPTKPLVEQHHKSFSAHFVPEAGSHHVFTGDVSPEKRAQIWKETTFVYATPQSLENDILSNRIRFEEVSLVIFDEAHHAVGDYAYVYLSKRYDETSRYPRALGLTASPGANVEHIIEVCKNLKIKEIEVRSTDDADVAPYLQDTDIKWVHVELTPEMLEIKKNLDECFSSKVKEAQNIGLLAKGNLTKTDLLKAQAEIHGRISHGERDFETLRSISLIAEAMKISHAQELLESQGLNGLQAYFQKMDAEAGRTTTKAVKNLVRDASWRMAYVKTNRLVSQGIKHPKIPTLIKLLIERISDKPGEKAIVFTQFRETAKEITDELNNQTGICAEIFVGQAKKGTTGSSRKEQAAILSRFRENACNVLVATSVAEEGLDIPSVNLVVFYEPIPSAIRSIQRRGRTGRNDRGEIHTLVTKGTRDEIYRWSAHHKEKKMYRTLSEIKRTLRLKLNEEGKGQRTLLETQPTSSVLIRVDPREKGSAVMKTLIERGAQLDLARLESGDYQLSPRVLVEYKTSEDFVDSITDGRLFNQAKNMKAHAVRSLFIIEGERDVYSVRQVHPNAINGAISTLAVSFNTPVIFTRNPGETAAMLISIAEKEGEYGLRNFSGAQMKKPATSKEQQEFFMASLPGVSGALARGLLEHFGTPAKALNASVDELKEVPLIGEKKATEIHKVLHEEYPRNGENGREKIYSG
ncbi:MAG: DEAD/DEAH box helicase [Nanoarchaeota archaeon]